MAKEAKDPGRQYDERLAKSYLEKSAKGERPTRAEHYAYKKIKKDHDSAVRNAAFDSITKGEWKSWSGCSIKVINEQGQRYGAPFARPKFTAGELAFWMHRFLADRHDALNRPAETPVDAAIKAEKLRRLRRENAIAEGRMVDVDEEMESIELLGRMIRELGENLQRQFGPSAGALVVEMLEEWEQVCENRFGGNREKQSNQANELPGATG